MPGYLKSEYCTCGKADCPCRRDRAKRHGPYWVLVWWQDGRKRRRHVPHTQVAALRARLAQERALRGELRSFKNACAELRDDHAEMRKALAQLAAGAALPTASAACPPVRTEGSRERAEDALRKLLARCAPQEAEQNRPYASLVLQNATFSRGTRGHKGGESPALRIRPIRWYYGYISPKHNLLFNSRLCAFAPLRETTDYPPFCINAQK